MRSVGVHRRGKKIKITSKAAILLPCSLLKELIKNRGFANGGADP